MTFGTYYGKSVLVSNAPTIGVVAPPIDGQSFPTGNVERMLMAYLPMEKILIEADLFDTPQQGEQLPDAAKDLNDALLNKVRQIGLEVELIAPIHGAAIKWADAVNTIQR